MDKKRSGDGHIVVDPRRFPSGMAALGKYIHERRLKFGIYSCAGETTCEGLPGSYGHEREDAADYASWGGWLPARPRDTCTTRPCDAYAPEIRP